jgi:hypothetical protein
MPLPDDDALETDVPLLAVLTALLWCVGIVLASLFPRRFGQRADSRLRALPLA